MSKEMYISSSPHETKVAVLEDDQLVEVYFERDTDVGLVGGIYKGRVNRALPGMQSAFVDIGLERDAFLYVSDFFYEDQEEYDKVFEEAEARAAKFSSEQAIPPAAPPPVAPVQSETVTPSAEATAPAAASAAPPSEPEPPAATAVPPPSSSAGPSATPAAPREGRDRRPFDRGRGRRRRHRGRPDFGEGRHGDRRFPPPRRSDEAPAQSQPFEILPGESLAKYSHPSAAPEESRTEISQRAGAEAFGEAASARDETDFQEDNLSRNPREPLGGAETVYEAAITDDIPARSETAQTSAFPEAAVTHEVPPEAAAPTDQFDQSDAALPFAPGVVRGVTPSASSETFAAEEADEGPGPALSESGPVADNALPDSEESASMDFAEAEFVAEGAELDAGEQADGGEEGEQEGFEEESAAGEAHPPEIIAAAEGEAPASAPEAAPTGGPGDRSYTLREPHQRPRFAPRHRRGRRGQGGGQRQSFRPRESSRPGNNHPVQISEVLKEGQEILVQIAKEPLGTKGARITSHVALPGRYLVFMPTIDHIGVSRKIASEEERLRLRNIILENRGTLTGGFIVRTAGQGRSEEEFKADLKFLSTLWAEIRSKSERLRAPALIHRDLDLVQRLLRDLLTPDFKCVRVDSEIDYERVLDFVNRCQPALVGKVKLYTSDTPLYEEFGIQAELDKALKPKVWLKSGGYIVINQTEALVAVDVNTGKYVGKTNRLEDTIVKTNIDAVKEIVRQVRLRDLGGIIVIDFIDMDERRNRARVVQALEEALRGDRAPTKVISFHDFGLVAVTRKRVKQSLERTLCEPCEYCTGAGWVKSVNTVCNEILAEARKMAKGIDGKIITLRVSPGVAKALKSREGSLISELESLVKKEIIIKTDPSIHQERFEIF